MEITNLAERETILNVYQIAVANATAGAIGERGKQKKWQFAFGMAELIKAHEIIGSTRNV